MRFFIPFLVITFAAFSSCLSDEEYSSSPKDVLTFSVDTVDLDTLISGELAHTRTLLVYNTNKSALRIASVSLLNGEHSIFRANVDGTALHQGVASDFEVRSGDSLRIFVNALPPSADSDTPIGYTDKLLFQLESGIIQELPLEIHGLDVIKLEGCNLYEDFTLTAKRPYQIMDSLVVHEGAHLNIEAGAQLLFHPEATLIVYGSVNAQGSVTDNIVFRGDRLGNMFTNQSYDHIPGQWGGIRICAQSFGNIFNYVDIHSGDFGIRCDSSQCDIEKLRVENSVIHNMSGNLLTLINGKAFIGNSQLTNAGGNCLHILGGDVEIVHTTIGQFYPFHAGRGVALSFSNHDGVTSHPLQRLFVVNSIITGYASDEIMGNNQGENAVFNYTFTHCLLNTPAYESPEIVNCIWDTDTNPVSRADNFAPPFDLDRLYYTFYLDEKSMAVGTADPNYSSRYYPFDRLGTPRSNLPSMGCYELNTFE